MILEPLDDGHHVLRVYDAVGREEFGSEPAAARRLVLVPRAASTGVGERPEADTLGACAERHPGGEPAVRDRVHRANRSFRLVEPQLTRAFRKKRSALLRTHGDELRPRGSVYVAKVQHARECAGCSEDRIFVDDGMRRRAANGPRPIFDARRLLGRGGLVDRKDTEDGTRRRLLRDIAGNVFHPGRDRLLKLGCAAAGAGKVVLHSQVDEARARGRPAGEPRVERREAIAASLLAGDEPGDPLAIRRGLRLRLHGPPPRHQSLLKNS